MKKLATSILALTLVSGTLFAAASPAFALGGCGPNYHRNAWGRCVWGGQNQDYCLRRTGHTATRMPDGRLVCVR